MSGGGNDGGDGNVFSRESSVTSSKSSYAFASTYNYRDEKLHRKHREFGVLLGRRNEESDVKIKGERRKREKKLNGAPDSANDVREREFQFNLGSRVRTADENTGTVCL